MVDLMRASRGLAMRCRAFMLQAALVLATLAPALAAEPTTDAQLRLETGMHTATIQSIDTDATGRWAVTASDDKTARIWDVASGRQLAVLRPPQDRGNEGKLYAAAMSPDGRIVATGGWTGYDWVRTTSVYLFDRASGRLLRRIDGLPEVINHLGFSPDGRWLSVGLAASNGIRLYDSRSGAEGGRDTDYAGTAMHLQFSADARRLYSASYDGKVRAYAVDAQGRPSLLRSATPIAGKRAFRARLSPDGRLLAVSYNDATDIVVLDASTLAEVARPAVTGVDNGNLVSVAWSADGRTLAAAGRWDVDGRHPVRVWRVGDWTQYVDHVVSGNSVTDLIALPAAAGAGWLFTAADPTWGRLDADGGLVRRQPSAVAELRGQFEAFRVSADGLRVRFGYLLNGGEPRVYAVGARTLDAAAAAAADLRPARIDADGLAVTQWKHYYDPQLNGKALPIERFEIARSLAIAPDGKRFLLGADWSLRLFDASGQVLQRVPAPGTVWAVNISADSRFAVVGYGDGTIRWHRLDDLRELLAFFPHADRKRWIAWTPEGYFDASPGAEDLIGFHLNQGRDREGEFVSSRQLWETFYQPGLVARRLDADGDRLLAEQVQRRGDIRNLLKSGSVPEIELTSAASTQTSGSYTLSVRIRNAGQGDGRLVVRVDGVELAGRWNAPALTPGRVVSMPVDLGEGLRRLSVELVDARGVASRPVTAQVQVARPAGPVASLLHVLAIGVTQYRDQALARGVAFAADDAVAVGAAFERGAAGLHARVRPQVLRNEQATRAGIEAAARQLAADVKPEDTVVIYLAGHGVTANGEYHFLPWETRYTNFEALVSQALSADALRQMLAQISARKVLVLLDTCSSGRFSLVKGREIDDKASLDRLQRVTGRAVIAAAADEKMALEGEERHGVFTYALLRALEGAADRDRDGLVSVSEVGQYIDEQVPAITKRKWGYEQFPMMETRGSVFPLVRRGN